MDSKLSGKKLSGVVKSYRKTGSSTSQCLKSRHLATINVNRALKLASDSQAVGKLIRNNGKTSRPSPPQPLAVIKEAKPATTSLSLNVERKRPKLSKWDFKGRLAYAEEDLVISKNNLKNATSRRNELTAELAELVEKEKFSKERAERAVELHEKLVEERDSLASRTDKLQKVANGLKKEVDGLNSELCETLERLKETKESYENHDSKMSQLAEDIERIKGENNGHEETVEGLKKHNKELEIALDGIQEKRQEMIDVIRLMKGND